MADLDEVEVEVEVEIALVVDLSWCNKLPRGEVLVRMLNESVVLEEGENPFPCSLEVYTRESVVIAEVCKFDSRIVASKPYTRFLSYEDLQKT